MARVPAEREIVAEVQGPSVRPGRSERRSENRERPQRGQPSTKFPGCALFWNGRDGYDGPMFLSLSWNIEGWPTGVLAADAKGIIRYRNPDRSKLDALIADSAGGADETRSLAEPTRLHVVSSFLLHGSFPSFPKLRLRKRGISRTDARRGPNPAMLSQLHFAISRGTSTATRGPSARGTRRRTPGPRSRRCSRRTAGRRRVRRP